MIPIAFVTDHIETLYELGVELVEDLEEEGFEFESMKVMKGLNDHPHYIKALAQESLRVLKHEVNPDDIEWEKDKAQKKEVTV
jgi:ferrochelatase